MLRRRLQPRRHRRAAPRLLVQLAPSAFSGRASRARPLRRNAPGSARHRRLYPPASRGRAGSHAQLRARVSKASARRIPAVRLQPALQRPLGKLQQPLRAEEQDLRSGVRERIPGLRRRVSVETTGARGNATRGFNGRGGLQRWPDGLRAGATQAAPRSSRQSGLAAVWPIVTHTPPNPHIAFRRAPPFISMCVEVRRSDNPHKTAGGSASRNGEARRKAPARQSEATAAPGRITGGGGRAV